MHDFVREHLGAKLKVVRKSNLKKDPALEDEFKKLNLLLEFILRRYYAPLTNEGKVNQWKVFFQDEGRFGLMTVLKRAITLSGVKPVGPYQHRFIYRYCYSLIEPMKDDHSFVTAPHINTLYLEYMLQEFSAHV